MVDATRATESGYMNADLVNNSKTKTLVILEAGKYEDTDYGEKLTIKVEIDGKPKTWRPNKDTCSNIAKKHGMDTITWVGKKITLSVIKMMGKETIAGVPE